MTPHSLLAPARLAGVPLLRSQSDERLVDLARAGNDAAFEAIVARYRRPLLRHCTRMLSEERAEDVVQQAFLRALRAMRADERPLDLRPWLYTIVHNAALNALRDRTVPSDTLEEEIDGVERPEQAFERRESLREVFAAVGALPERQRDALVLRELEGRTYDEIAVKLGVSDGAVRQLLNRARNTLRAGVTAVTPAGMLLRLPLGAEDPLTARIAELTAGGAGVGAVAAKACATALVAGAVVGGVAVAPEGRSDAPRPPSVRGAVADAREEAAEAGGSPSRSTDQSRRGAAGDDRRRGGQERRGTRRGSDDSRKGSAQESEDDRSGPGDSGRSGDRSGPGGDGDSSGPGSGEHDRSGSSGPGSGGGGSSGSGSGSPDSGSSGSGSSGSGSGSSGSGSGSGSSGSGSGSESGDGSGSGSGSSGRSSGSGPSDGAP